MHNYSIAVIKYLSLSCSFKIKIAIFVCLFRLCIVCMYVYVCVYVDYNLYMENGSSTEFVYSNYIIVVVILTVVYFFIFE